MRGGLGCEKCDADEGRSCKRAQCGRRLPQKLDMSIRIVRNAHAEMLVVPIVQFQSLGASELGQVMNRFLTVLAKSRTRKVGQILLTRIRNREDRLAAPKAPHASEYKRKHGRGEGFWRIGPLEAEVVVFSHPAT